MAIDVTWPTPSTPIGIIHVPKADTSVISAGPPEIRGIDLNFLRGEVSLLWASSDGGPYSNPFVHQRESTISNFVYVRQVRWNPPYTVEFEAGSSYTVVTSGANHNTADVQVQNGVGLVVQNSAGLLNNNADLALAVMQALLPSGRSLEDSIDLIRKVHTNRLEAAPGNPGVLTLFDDDDATPILTMNIRDYLAGAVVGTIGSPALRAKSTI